MPTTVLYRRASGEVLRISTSGQPFTDLDTRRFGVLINPSLPDGQEYRVPWDPQMPQRVRQRGVTKIALPAANTVRNATQAELDNFQPQLDDDINAIDAVQAQLLLTGHPQWSKVLGSVVEALMDEINALRAVLALPPRSGAVVLQDTTGRIERSPHGHPRERPRNVDRPPR